MISKADKTRKRQQQRDAKLAHAAELKAAGRLKRAGAARGDANRIRRGRLPAA